jgi:hypothetical protein
MHVDLMQYAASVKGRARLGVEVLAHALLIVPKTLVCSRAPLRCLSPHGSYAGAELGL